MQNELFNIKLDLPKSKYNKSDSASYIEIHVINILGGRERESIASDSALRFPPGTALQIRVALPRFGLGQDGFSVWFPRPGSL
jgi:hypothetical protein